MAYVEVSQKPYTKVPKSKILNMHLTNFFRCIVSLREFCALCDSYIDGYKCKELLTVLIICSRHEDWKLIKSVNIQEYFQTLSNPKTIWNSENNGCVSETTKHKTTLISSNTFFLVFKGFEHEALLDLWKPFSFNPEINFST